VPDRYRHLKREWSGWDRAGIDRELKPMVKALRKPAQKESRVGYAPKLRQEFRREQEVKTRPGKRPSDRAGRRKADQLQTDRLESQRRKPALENERRSPRVESERRAAPRAGARRKPERVENERKASPAARAEEKLAQVESERQKPAAAAKSERGGGHGKEKRDQSSGGSDGPRKKR
jgi:hypothetical protein